MVVELVAKEDKTAFAVLVALSVSHLLNDTMQSLLPAIYPVLQVNYALTFTQIGVLHFAFQCTAALLQPVVGHITDKRTTFRLLPLGMGLSLIGLLLLAYATSYPALLKQWLGLLTVAWSNREAKLLFPGFPPGIPISLLFGRRAIPYIHDLFLLTRPDDLNLKAKLYMRPSFKYAIRNLNVFFVNSQKTEDDLRAFCKSSAKIIKFRPVVENCFDFNFVQRPSPKTLGGPLKLLMLGTLEPRKNYQYALWLHRTLREKWGNDAELHIVGREGWGVDVKRLAEEPNVHYHGYLEKDDIRALAENCNAYLSTSHDEGLGLPLLEMQYSGLPVIAVDIPVFKEVLNGSGLLIPQGDVAGAADAIVDYFTNVYDETTCPARALENIEHWNRVAEADRRSVIEYLSSEA